MRVGDQILDQRKKTSCPSLWFKTLKVAKSRARFIGQRYDNQDLKAKKERDEEEEQEDEEEEKKQKKRKKKRNGKK